VLPRLASALLIALMLAGSATGQTPAPKGVAEAKTNTSPVLPADYRKRMATSLARAYAEEGKGQPEISAVITQSGLLGEVTTDVCIRYPADVKFTWAQRRARHAIFLCTFPAQHSWISSLHCARWTSGSLWQKLQRLE
jgi:hypothetical protein